eukprot:g488.t1
MHDRSVTTVAACILVAMLIAVGVVLHFRSDARNTLHLSSNNVGPVCDKWRETFNPPNCAARETVDRLRTSFRDENCAIAQTGPRRARAVGKKVEKLADNSPFVFFRGAAAYFYYNFFCDNQIHSFRDDKAIPQVVSNGDCHPENFGVMETANEGTLVWGVNDFDQSFQAPFTIDLARCATGFVVACDVQREKHLSGIKTPGITEDNSIRCDEYSRLFLKGYVDVVTRSERLTVDDLFVSNSRATRRFPMIRDLFVSDERIATTADLRKAWYVKKGVDLEHQVFKSTSKLRPLPAKDNSFWQVVVDQYLYNGPKILAKIGKTDPRSYFKVLSVAEKLGSGTGSVGLARFWVLVAGHDREDPLDNRVIEFKQETESVLERYSGLRLSNQLNGYRAAQGEQLAYPFANMFYSWADAMHKSFVVRERNLYKDDVAIESLTLDRNSFGAYARASGEALALYHLRASCADPSCRASDSKPVTIDRDVASHLRSYMKRVGKDHLENTFAQFSVEEAQRTARGHWYLKGQRAFAKFRGIPIENVTLS